MTLAHYEKLPEVFFFFFLICNFLEVEKLLQKLLLHGTGAPGSWTCTIFLQEEDGCLGTSPVITIQTTNWKRPSCLER